MGAGFRSRLAERRRTHRVRTKGLAILAVLAVVGILFHDAPHILKRRGGGNLDLSQSLDDQDIATSRRLERSRREKNPLYIPDLFIRKKHKRNQNGNSKFVFLHAIGVLYMFLALMIVCDNFFGPALDCMVEKWNIDDDVAGATFMAAGGSAPELATSYMGQFVSKSDIGFGTIVGSAVFNVLFVIACCALVVPGGCVQLSWWPLFRDCTCYIIGLLVLAMFVNAENNMVWYEAMLLFFGYLGYVTIMLYNAKLETYFSVLFHAHDRNTKVRPTANSGSTTAKSSDLAINDDSKKERITTEDNPLSGKGAAASEKRDSLRNVLVKAADETDMPISPGTNNGSAKILPESVAQHSGAELAERKKLEEKQDQAAPTETTAKQAVSNDAISDKPKNGDDDTEGWQNPWKWPESQHEQVLFVVTAPIKFCVYNTLPDCSHPDKEHLFKVTFFGSLVWLAVCAYCMVVWTTIVGATVGICDYVMGLTVLAAGTSIPDALSSMYMAREGRGDMAISSSIGSNVFDILVGLPVPVLTKYLFVAILGNGSGEWKFDTAGIVWDTVTLLLMVFAVVCSISYLGWVLNLKLGSVMFCLYFLFLVSSIVRNWRSCTG